MNRFLALLLLLSTRLLAAPPTAPGAELDAAAEPAWAPLFAKLATVRPVFSTFQELRWFGFRKTPVVLRGEMRLDPARGLSLRYTEPEERIVVVDAQGVLLRDRRGARALPADPAAGGLEQALLPALRFNLSEIRARFVLRGARDDHDWRLDLEPKDPTLRRSLGTLIIRGEGGNVTQLEFHRSASQRVLIKILSTEDPASFPAADLGRYFR